jgi:gluconate 2-dehydrogenase gamma chain
MVSRISRRLFLGTAGAALGAAAQEAVPEAEARTYSGVYPWAQGSDQPPPHAPAEESYTYLKSEEIAFIQAAISRLIPQDDEGPGAKELGVAVFLDRQLAGEFGRAQRWYMLGPWRAGSETQGYQSRLTPAELYRYAIAQIDDYSRRHHDGREFSRLSPDEQDALLTDLESGKVELQNVSGKAFFELLLQNTIEGYFADPSYGGNRDMGSWSMIGFPGARYDYRPWVSKHNQRFPLPPVSLHGRKEWTPKT